MAKMIQIRHVPDAVHGALKRQAARAGMSLSDYLRQEVAAIAARPSLDDMIAHLAARGSIEVDEAAADAVRSERDAR